MRRFFAGAALGARPAWRILCRLAFGYVRVILLTCQARRPRTPAETSRPSFASCEPTCSPWALGVNGRKAGVRGFLPRSP